MKPHHNNGRVFLVLALSGFLAACAGPGPRPEGELQAAVSSIQQAEGADAREYEPVLLNQAETKLLEARDLLDQEEYREAERLLEEAVVDAQLAAARAETEKTRMAVEQLNENIETLRQQLNERQP